MSPCLLKAACVHSGPVLRVQRLVLGPWLPPWTLSVAVAPASPPPCHPTSEHAWGIAGLDQRPTPLTPPHSTPTTPCPHPGPKVTPRRVSSPSAPPPPDSSPPPARRLPCAPSHESWVQPSGLLTFRALVRNPILFFFVMSQTGIDQSRGTLILGLIDRHGHTTHRCTNPTNTEKKGRHRTREGSPWDRGYQYKQPQGGAGRGGRRRGDTSNNTSYKGHFFFFFLPKYREYIAKQLRR